MSIKETYTLFKEENPTTKIDLTKFGYLCPKNVKFSSETPANVCTCIYHQNVILALDAMHKYVLEIPLYSKSFAEGCLLSSDEKCWYGNCDHDTCSFDSTYEKLQNSDDPAKWMKWEEVNGHVIKNKKKWFSWQSIQLLGLILLQYFFIHTFVKRKQARAMKMINLKLP